MPKPAFHLAPGQPPDHALPVGDAADAGPGPATVLIAMAGVPIASGADLLVLRADRHRFAIGLAREDKTGRLQRAPWPRVELGESLSR